MTRSEYIKYQIPEGQLTTFKTLLINCGKKLFWKQR